MLRSRRLWSLLLCFLLSFSLAAGPIPGYISGPISGPIQGLFSPAALATEPPSPSATALQHQGRKLYGLGQYAAAINIWQQAVEQLRRQGDSLGQASVLGNLALAYHRVDDWGQAQRAIGQSLDLLNAFGPAASPAAARTFAQVWNTHGNLVRSRSQAGEALDSFEQAANYYRQARDANGILRNQVNQAQALQSLGFYRRALTMLHGATLLDQPDSAVKVTGLQLLGDLQRATGDLEASQQTLEQALTLAQSLDAVDSTTLRLSLGHTAQARNDQSSALAAYQQAIATAATPQARLSAQLSQWSLLRELDKATAQESLYQQIQQTLAELPVSRTTVNARLELARQQLDPPRAMDQVVADLALARQQAIELNDPRAESYALGYLGELYRQQRRQDAAALLEQAVTLAESIDAPDLAYQWHWHLAQLQQQQDQPQLAIKSYEQAIINLQSLRNNLIAIAPDLRFNFREQVEPVYRQWVNLLLSETQQSTSVQQTQLTKARQAIESLQLAELENFFQEPCVPISQEIDQVIETADAPTAVVYPIILPDRLEIILKLPHQPLQQYTSPVSQIELESLLAQLQRDLQRPPFTLKQVQAESARLYDWLIRPLETTLAASQIDTLVFVLDGFLRSIPMAALYDGQQYLVENYGIALAPGLQLVDPRPLQGQKFATVIAGLSESRHGFSELPFVETEVDQIQGTTPSRVLFNESFTAANLEAVINDTSFPLVHLATHGQFSSDPNETFVLAWDQPISMNSLNRLLRQGEQTRQSAIELLILSACETASGDKRAALGLAGVAVQAGVRSTLASLWNLDDESGSIFASLFYQELQTPNISKAQALRHAQLQLLRGDKFANPIFEHPRYWAPYVLLGNWL